MTICSLAEKDKTTHSCSVDTIILDRHFLPWRYGIGHSQLLLRSPAEGSQPEAVHVLFEGVRAVKLRSSYRPLTLQRAVDKERERMLAFAGVPARLCDRMLCLTLPSEDEGFVVCGKATVLALPGNDVDTWSPKDTRVLFPVRVPPESAFTVRP